MTLFFSSARAWLLLSPVVWACYLPAAAQSGQPRVQTEPMLMQALYRVTYQPDSTAPTKLQETMLLEIGPTLSKFQSPVMRQRDSLMATLSSVKDNAQDLLTFTNKISGLPKTRFQYKIYKYPQQNRVEYMDRIGVKYYRNEAPLNSLRWTIHPQEQATVAGYACQRATTTFAGRSYEAWFTREVPVLDGPYRFSGLPGLIVKVGDLRQQYVFELTQLRDLRGSQRLIVRDELPTLTATTQEIYGGQIRELQSLRNSQLSASAASGAGDAPIRLSAERLNEINRTLNTYNNRIELK